MQRPTKGWGGKTEFRKLSGELAAQDGVHFQRSLLPLVAALYDGPIEMAAMRRLDRHGIDLMVWSDDGLHPVVVQAKGFQVSPEEVGLDQAEQCTTSIQKFLDSGIRVHTYLLVHNRDSRNPEFQEPLMAAVSVLRESDQVEEAYAWDRAEFLRHVFQAVYERAFDALVQSRDAGIGPFGLVPIERVPVRTSAAAISQFAFSEVGEASTSVIDPVSGLLDAREGVVSVLLGEFGSGKTTVTQRAANVPGANVLLVDAGRISKDITGTKDVLAVAEHADYVLSLFPIEHRSVLQPILRPALEQILLNPESPAILLIDGLDESAFLAKPRGLGQLFEMMAQVRVPVVLTARTEFWTVAEKDFIAFLDSYPPRGPTSSKPPIRCFISELLPWSEEQIHALVSRIRAAAGQLAAARLDELDRALQSGRFFDYYGDIPRRPFFLSLLIDDVMASGLGVKGRAGLVDEWVKRKISRDVTAPTGFGKRGRTPLAAGVEDVGSTLDLAYDLMKTAATRMLRVEADTVTLLPSLSSDELGKPSNALGLVLNTLLIPVGPKMPGRPLDVKFAHRAFQEFFVAMAVRDGSASIGSADLPVSVADWVVALESEFPVQD